MMLSQANFLDTVRSILSDEKTTLKLKRTNREERHLELLDEANQEESSLDFRPSTSRHCRSPLRQFKEQAELEPTRKPSRFECDRQA